MLIVIVVAVITLNTSGLVSKSIPNVLTDNRVDQISSSRKIIKVIIFSLHSIELFLAVDQCVCRSNLYKNVRFYTYN